VTAPMTQNRDLQKISSDFSWPCVAAATNRDKRSHLVIDDVSASSSLCGGIIFPLGRGGWERGEPRAGVHFFASIVY
jgi:hypothetical protein